MAKCYVEIGFIKTEEKLDGTAHTGIWEENIVPKMYYAEIYKNYRNTTSDNKVNSDVLLNNTFSILADPYANDNYFAMRYIKFNNVKWEITNVEVEYPRLIINVGGIYNG